MASNNIISNLIHQQSPQNGAQSVQGRGKEISGNFSTTLFAPNHYGNVPLPQTQYQTQEKQGSELLHITFQDQSSKAYKDVPQHQDNMTFQNLPKILNKTTNSPTKKTVVAGEGLNLVTPAININHYSTANKTPKQAQSSIESSPSNQQLRLTSFFKYDPTDV